jgi:membrane-associated protease RseP (regulator of RpoE activity)
LISARVDASNLNHVVKTLRGVDRQILNELRKELRGKIQPYANSIAQAVPAQSPLSGMRHDGVTRWSGKPKATVSFTPGKSRSGNRLLSIRLTGGSAGRGPLGFDYAELAGVRKRAPKPFSKLYERNGLLQQHRVNGQGDAMISQLRRKKPIRGKAGYFAFDEALQKYPLLTKIGVLALEKFGAKVSRELIVRDF